MSNGDFMRFVGGFMMVHILFNLVELNGKLLEIYTGDELKSARKCIASG